MATKTLESWRCIPIQMMDIARWWCQMIFLESPTAFMMLLRLVHQGAFKETHERWGLMLSAGVYTVQVEGQRALRWIVR